jgi:hypothetical protein
MAGDLSLPCETLAAKRKRKQEKNEDTKLVNLSAQFDLPGDT